MAASHQEDEIIGKAYDSRLMRRLMQYLRPYWLMTLFALVTTLIYGILQAVPAYLMKVEVDRYLDPAHGQQIPAPLANFLSHDPRVGIIQIALCSFSLSSSQLPIGICPIIHDAIGGAEGHVRPEEGNLSPLAAAGSGLL